MEKIVWLQTKLDWGKNEVDTSEVNKLLEQGWQVKEVSTSAASNGDAYGAYGQIAVVLTNEK